MNTLTTGHPSSQVRPITSERVQRYFEGIFGKGFRMPPGKLVEKYKTDVLKALWAQELSEFAVYPHMERVLKGENFISPWIRYSKEHFDSIN